MKEVGSTSIKVHTLWRPQFRVMTYDFEADESLLASGCSTQRSGDWKSGVCGMMHGLPAVRLDIWTFDELHQRPLQSRLLALLHTDIRDGRGNNCFIVFQWCSFSGRYDVFVIEVCHRSGLLSLRVIAASVGSKWSLSWTSMSTFIWVINLVPLTKMLGAFKGCGKVR